MDTINNSSTRTIKAQIKIDVWEKLSRDYCGFLKYLINMLCKCSLYMGKEAIQKPRKSSSCNFLYGLINGM